MTSQPPGGAPLGSTAKARPTRSRRQTGSGSSSARARDRSPGLLIQQALIRYEGSSPRECLMPVRAACWALISLGERLQLQVREAALWQAAVERGVSASCCLQLVGMMTTAATQGELLAPGHAVWVILRGASCRSARNPQKDLPGLRQPSASSASGWPRCSASTATISPWSSRCGRPETVIAPMQVPPASRIGKPPPWVA
jgi:hypothetical protein